MSFHELVYPITFSHTHTPCPFSQIALVYSRRSERICEIFKFFLGVLLQDPASKVSFWTLLAFILFQSPHIGFFSVSPQLCSFSSSCCVWCQWCVYVCCCCLLCVSCFFKHARMWICVGPSMLFCEFHIHSICSTFATVWQVLFKMFNGICWASCSLHDSKSYGNVSLLSALFLLQVRNCMSCFCVLWRFQILIICIAWRIKTTSRNLLFPKFWIPRGRNTPATLPTTPPLPNHGASECESASPPLPEKN